MEYTVEISKNDRRTLTGSRIVSRQDIKTELSREEVLRSYQLQYPKTQGYRVDVSETYVEVRSLMTGTMVRIRAQDRGSRASDPSMEGYWTM